MARDLILALDQGTTSSKSILFDAEGAVVAAESKEFAQIYPEPGWVEHDPEDIWQSQIDTARQVLKKAGAAPSDVAALGITNQRETTVIWDRKSGAPVHNAIVWQCRRTAARCEQLAAEGLGAEFQARTGLVLDAYFSGTKAEWLLDHVDGLRERAARGGLCFGTIDTWLLYKLTGQHATDPSNASRTLMYNIHTRSWDKDLLAQLRVPAELLPEVRPTSHAYGVTTALGGEIPVAALCGDQQSALFGQTAFQQGESKNTYGTGCFLLMNTGAEPVASRQGLLTTVAWEIDGAADYALEGSVFIGGAVVQWLRDELGLISTAADSETVAAMAGDTAGVYLVPAFVGLGAPYWDMRARGVIVGLTRGAGTPQIVRAGLESISFQSADVLQAMQSDSGRTITALRVDGGASQNNLLLQHQADVLGIPVVRGKVLETTSLGAAFLAGLAVGLWPSRDALRGVWREDRVFEPQWDSARRDAARAAWTRAVEAARSYGR